MYYDNAASGTKVTLVYNVAGTRIYAAGPSYVRSAQFSGSLYRGSLFELPRHLLDFTISQRVFRSLQVKATVQNLLNQPIRMAEDFNTDFKYTKKAGSTATGISPAIPKRWILIPAGIMC